MEKVFGGRKPILILDPYGFRMSQIPESDLPFPPRKGNLYTIVEHTCPRAAYFNYRDIDRGRNQGSKCHDYEGLSYTSQRPFVIIDLANLRKITINTVDETAWIEAGATFGELNYQITKKDDTLGFPASVSPTMGAVMGISVERRWSQLIRAPPKVTVFSISKNLEEGATKLVYNWQNVAHKLHKDLNLEKISEAEIKGLYLGRIKRLMPLINSSSPELDLKEQDCREMRWLESILFFDNGYSKNESTDHLLVRNYHGRVLFKSKSDFVTDPISESDLEGIQKKFITSKTMFG
ncbi:berberine bridge enzyme-like 18 [Rhododendron vialii]|uniref:berberine bridge enzyme-like 18 n=1 Tax=Rhododendron vialii TaxID=182163 RepID=UPI00265F5389|nr:berberine bridge enzyme-like 18 [Rhododendron vialii]